MAASLAGHRSLEFGKLSKHFVGGWSPTPTDSFGNYGDEFDALRLAIQFSSVVLAFEIFVRSGSRAGVVHRGDEGVGAEA